MGIEQQDEEADRKFNDAHLFKDNDGDDDDEDGRASRSERLRRAVTEFIVQPLVGFLDVQRRRHTISRVGHNPRCGMSCCDCLKLPFVSCMLFLEIVVFISAVCLISVAMRWLATCDFSDLKWTVETAQTIGIGTFDALAWGWTWIAPFNYIVPWIRCIVVAILGGLAAAANYPVEQLTVVVAVLFYYVYGIIESRLISRLHNVLQKCRCISERVRRVLLDCIPQIIFLVSCVTIVYPGCVHFYRCLSPASAVEFPVYISRNTTHDAIEPTPSVDRAYNLPSLPLPDDFTTNVTTPMTSESPVSIPLKAEEQNGAYLWLTTDCVQPSIIDAAAFAFTGTNRWDAVIAVSRSGYCIAKLAWQFTGYGNSDSFEQWEQINRYAQYLQGFTRGFKLSRLYSSAIRSILSDPVGTASRCLSTARNMISHLPQLAREGKAYARKLIAEVAPSVIPDWAKMLADLIFLW